MEDYTRRVQIPAFGNWDYFDEMPITQYFESAMQAGLNRGHADLFKVPASPEVAVAKPVHHHRKVRKSGGGERKMTREQQLRKQGKVYDLTNQSPKKATTTTTTTTTTNPKTPKAVDEDLYKIPAELLYQKPKKKKRLLRNLWSGCLGLNCIT